MKRWRRRILLATFYIGSLAGVAVLTAYYTRNFTGRGPTPGRAGFARRLPGVDDGDYRRYPFFFATNRAKISPPTRRSGTELADFARPQPLRLFCRCDDRSTGEAGEQRGDQDADLRRHHLVVAAREREVPDEQ